MFQKCFTTTYTINDGQPLFYTGCMADAVGIVLLRCLCCLTCKSKANRVLNCYIGFFTRESAQVKSCLI